MSAFLGPIHHWLYNKIQIQEGLIQYLLVSLSDRAVAEQLETEITDQFGRLPEGDLASVIDETNIHGWLQGQIAVVERRLAYVITEIKTQNRLTLNEICDLAFEYGRNKTSQTAETMEEAYQVLENNLLNGMPCDHVNQIMTTTVDSFIWERTTEIHEQYWLEVNGDVSDYYAVRDALSEGILNDAGYTIRHLEETKYELRRKTCTE